MKSTNDIISIVRAGGSIIIDSTKSTNDIISIVRAAGTNSQITIKNASKKSTNDIISIARASVGKPIIFDLVD